MKTSLANSPIIPLVGGIAAAALIFGTLSNGGEEIEPVSSESSTDVGATDLNAAPPADTAAPTETVPEEVAATAGALTVGKAGKVGGLALTATKANAKGATVTVAKKSYALKTGKAAKIGKYTVTVTKATAKKVNVEVSK
ncbi:MAG: hypothetical protein ACT4QF_19125 [Sporichthyaceae bacterium]